VCVEPIIRQIRGKDFEVKSHIYKQLNTAQQALLMFQVLYGHSHNGIAQFYASVDYLLEKSVFWPELKAGLQYFRDDAMLQIIEKMEVIYHSGVIKQHQVAECSGIFPKKIDASASLDEINKLYNEIMPATLKRISDYIRNNPANFVQIET
jgi:hypothetical protein